MGQQLLVAELELVVVCTLEALDLGLPPEELREHRDAAGGILARIVVEDADAEQVRSVLEEELRRVEAGRRGGAHLPGGVRLPPPPPRPAGAAAGPPPPR